ncbi:hypothetical protein GCM10014719_49630 [Planomonospora parontospora subsp. antibiotica]|nr:hypothetical protein GCM10014719_49630 [Planomonospora parontospora subsp. antibiotica]GII18398.1 hypothetical protein Ppa05_51240 [Planomonospora parontospora subsp. antibiotica]
MFVRHGEAASTTDVWDADDQRPLTPAGDAAARRAAEEMAAFAPDRLYCSPSLRARMTAERISAQVGLSPGLEPGLVERTFRTLEGRSLTEIAARHGSAVMELIDRRNTDTLELDGDEPFTDAVRRAAGTVERLMAGPHRRVVAVSHGGPHCWMLSAFCGVPPEDRLFTLAEAHFTVLGFRTVGNRVRLSRIIAINTATIPLSVRR